MAVIILIVTVAKRMLTMTFATAEPDKIEDLFQQQRMLAGRMYVAPHAVHL